MHRFASICSRFRPCLESLELRLNPATLSPQPMPEPTVPLIQLPDETPLLLGPIAPPGLAVPAQDLNVPTSNINASAIVNAMHERSPAFAPFSVDFISAANHVSPQYVSIATPATSNALAKSVLFVASQSGDDERDVAHGSALFGVGGNADDANAVTTRRVPLAFDETEPPPVTPKKSPEPADAPSDEDASLEQICV